MTKLEDKLKALQGEYEAGQKMLADLDARRSAVLSTLLRIEGAIQVLQELSTPAANGRQLEATGSVPSLHTD